MGKYNKWSRTVAGDRTCSQLFCSDRNVSKGRKSIDRTVQRTLYTLVSNIFRGNVREEEELKEHKKNWKGQWEEMRRKWWKTTLRCSIAIRVDSRRESGQLGREKEQHTIDRLWMLLNRWMFLNTWLLTIVAVMTVGTMMTPVIIVCRDAILDSRCDRPGIGVWYRWLSRG